MQGMPLSVDGAAARLGVGARRVRALIVAGELPAERVGGRWVVDSAVADRFSRRERRSGRRLSAGNAWALLACLSGREDVLESRPPRSRGRIELLARGGGDDLAGVLGCAESRAVIHDWKVLPGDLKRLAEDARLARSGLSADAAELDVRYQADRDGLDGYVAHVVLDGLRVELRPVVDSVQPNLRLRVPLGADWILHGPRVPPAVAAADLLGHDDPRVVRAARDALRGLAR